MFEMSRWGNLKENVHLADLRVFARITSKYILKNMMGWGGFNCCGAGQMQLPELCGKR